MSAENFLACFNETESFEGGYVNNPHDPGGATLKGVTQGAYNSWRVGQGLAVQPVRQATDAEIQEIYRQQYWNPVRGDDLYAGLDLVMVDYGWGSGPVTAIRHLQKVLGVSIDGQFGLETMGAIRPFFGARGSALINQLCDDRTAFFQSLSTWVYFGRGWTVRLNGIRAKALAMNSGLNR